MAAFRRFGAHLSGEMWTLSVTHPPSEFYELRAASTSWGPRGWRATHAAPLTGNAGKRRPDEVTLPRTSRSVSIGFSTAESKRMAAPKNGGSKRRSVRVREAPARVALSPRAHAGHLGGGRHGDRLHARRFPVVSGFRSGTCRPFNAYSLRAAAALTPPPCATAIMDFRTVRREVPRPYDRNRALRRCRPAVRLRRRRYGRRLVVLYHSGDPPAPSAGFMNGDCRIRCPAPYFRSPRRVTARCWKHSFRAIRCPRLHRGAEHARHLVLRHDIDIAKRRRCLFGRIEQELRHSCAHYFVLVTRRALFFLTPANIALPSARCERWDMVSVCATTLRRIATTNWRSPQPGNAPFWNS